MPNSNNNNTKGFSLALITAIMWGLLPLGLGSVLHFMDSYTITFYRFIFAAVFVGLMLFSKKNIPMAVFKDKKIFSRIFIAAILLSLNYILYLTALYYVPAETAQMLIQMAPFMMLVGSVIFLNESFSPGQMVGSVVLITGLVLFFNQQFTQSADINNEDFITGFLIMIGASLTWASYAILQKKMLNKFSSNQIMWCIYLFSSLLFFPATTPSDVTTLSVVSLLLLLFCCANTLVAYGTFAESLEYWPASKVSAVLAITPLLTVLFATIAAKFFPDFIQAQALNTLAYLGACLVVTGSILTALGNRIINKNNYDKVKKALSR